MIFGRDCCRQLRLALSAVVHTNYYAVLVYCVCGALKALRQYRAVFLIMFCFEPQKHADGAKPHACKCENVCEYVYMSVTVSELNRPCRSQFHPPISSLINTAQ